MGSESLPNSKKMKKDAVLKSLNILNKFYSFPKRRLK
jgi:hypothetical protein